MQEKKDQCCKLKGFERAKFCLRKLDEPGGLTETRIHATSPTNSSHSEEEDGASR